jgi:ElaB/YqjD/DUF883 family membrane-anchored ribosome-binding protein
MARAADKESPPKQKESGEGQRMASRNTPIDRSGADKTASFGKELADRTGEAIDSMSDMTRTATRKVDEGRSLAADRLDGVASAVKERVGELPGGERVKEFASAAADRLSTTADYMRTHDAKRMVADAETVVKNNPGPALLVAAVFGFVVGWSLTRK